MEAAGGINEIYNFNVSQMLTNSYNQATAAFNSTLGLAQGTSYTSMAAINSIAYISQAQANGYINAGAAAAFAVGSWYGCSPGAITMGAVNLFASDVQTAKDTTNVRIANVQANKVAQYNQYQAWLAEQAWLAQQAAATAMKSGMKGTSASAKFVGSHSIGSYRPAVPQVYMNKAPAQVGLEALKNTLTFKDVGKTSLNPTSLPLWLTSPLAVSGKTLTDIANIVGWILNAEGTYLKNGFSQLATYKDLTQQGRLDWAIDLAIGATPDKNGIYHIDQDYWQSWKPVGYNKLYDEVLKMATWATGTSAYANDFNFATADGSQYNIWVWKGDYINLGAGAETGIYKDPILGEAHWLTAPEDALSMTLRLADTRGKQIFYYAPDQEQWWITGFDPQHQNMQASDLRATVTIDFTGRPDLWNGFTSTQLARRDNQWVFDPSSMTARLVY
jgi:hypothetical protein